MGKGQVRIMKTDTEHTILEQAALWFARQEDDALSDADQQVFDNWLAASERHRAVYHEVSGVWYEAAQLPKPAPQTKIVQFPANDARKRRPSVFGSWQSVAAAGLFAAVSLSGFYLYDVPTRIQADAYTTKGQSKHIALPDGSTVDLNTASAIEILYSPHERAIRLLKGEALFSVAPDKTRPFKILTNEGAATALGTVYAVKQATGYTEVTVLESKVEVQGKAEAAPAAILHANEQASFTRTSVSPVSPVDADSVTAWRRGKLIVNDRPLREVIAELNRYHAGMIRIIDSDIGSDIGKLRISGVFETNNTSAVVSDLEAALQIHSTRLSDYLILLHR